MVTLSSCQFWQIICFTLPQNEYGCVYVWTTLGSETEDANVGKKKNHLFRWSSFWSWRVCKQAKLSHLRHRKPARIHWKADASKTSHCLVRILVQRHDWAIFLRMANAIGPCWMNFCSQNTFDFNWTALRATQPKLHSMFCALFLKIALSAVELMSFGHLGAAI